METLSENKCFGGTQGVYRHASKACQCDMTFAVFMPEEASEHPVPVLWFLSGLTCTHENAMVKAGAQAWAAQVGIALVFPDTSPRGEGVSDDNAYDLGQGAGFYVNATQEPWLPHYQMWDYISAELPSLISEYFNIDMARQSITGHSMGGHGALTLALRQRGRYQSVSAFAPICNPTQSDWGRKQLGSYLGADETAWVGHDATCLVREIGLECPLLIDTGTSDQFYDLLGTAAMESALAEQKAEVTLRLQAGYDHSYFFVSTFIPDHIEFHARALFGT